MADLNAFQERVLQLASDFAAQFPHVKAVHIFGSVARGATDAAKDVDLFFELAAGDFRFGTAQEAHAHFQDELETWREQATQTLGKPVKVEPTNYGQHYPAIWQAIKNTPPTASFGKAFIVPTPDVKA